MHAVLTSSRTRRTRRRTRRSAAPILAVTLTAALSGTAGAAQLLRDQNDGGGVYVTPTTAPRVDEGRWLDAKLRTTAGYRVLVFE